jgi:hypothetical protein
VIKIIELIFSQPIAEEDKMTKQRLLSIKGWLSFLVPEPEFIYFLLIVSGGLITGDILNNWGLVWSGCCVVGFSFALGIIINPVRSSARCDLFVALIYAVFTIIIGILGYRFTWQNSFVDAKVAINHNPWNIWTAIFLGGVLGYIMTAWRKTRKQKASKG